MKMIDGKKINEQIGEDLLAQTNKLQINPSLGILCVGDDKASLSFMNVKKKFGEKYGFTVSLYKLDENVSKKDILEKIDEMEENSNAVIVQLPLPEKFKEDTNEIVEKINVKKDADNLTGKHFYESPIILALQKVLPEKFSKVAIVGMGKVVGIPVKEYCEAKNIEYVEVKKGEYEKIKDCDVVVSAVGVPHFIKKEYIMEGACLIDYGCSYKGDNLSGDFDPECFEIASKYTPVPGGMGPIVVSCLFLNVLKSCV